MQQWRITCMLISLVACTSGGRIASGNPAVSLMISGDLAQPAGAPVLVQLLVHNTGDAPISYWCDGPGEYPTAGDYVATVVRPDGSSKKVKLSNGQRPAGDGRELQIAPRRSIQFPATFGIMAPGSYRVIIDVPERNWDGITGPKLVTWPAMRSANVYQFVVRHDNDLAAARDAKIVSGIRANDPFARYLAATWSRRAVRQALVADLTGDDVVAADRAAEGLWGDADPAKIDGPLVEQVILKHLKAPAEGECDVGLMSHLLRCSVPPNSHRLKAAITQLMLARPEGLVRSKAAAALDPIETIVSAKRFQSPYQGEDAQRRLHQASMVAALLEMARSEDLHERRLAYQGLADFADSPQAAEAIHSGLNDSDTVCQALARKAWTGIVNHIATSRPN